VRHLDIFKDARAAVVRVVTIEAAAAAIPGVRPVVDGGIRCFVHGGDGEAATSTQGLFGDREAVWAS